MQCMIIWAHFNNTQPKNFDKNTKNPKNRKLRSKDAWMHEEKEKEEIKNTYQVRETWIRPK